MHTEDKLMLKIIIAVFALIIIVALAETAGAADGYQPNDWVRTVPTHKVPSYEMQQYNLQEQLRQQNQEMLKEYNQIKRFTVYDYETNRYKFCQQIGNNISCY